MDGHTLDHAPLQACCPAFSLTDAYLLAGPHLAVRYVVQRRDYVGDSGLAYVLERYGILRTVPAPALSHRISHILNALNPPSTTLIVPVTPLEASEAR